MRAEWHLTEREMEICQMIAQGINSGQIAKLLFLAEGTVKNHITSIYEKTGAKNRAQLAVKYMATYGQAVTDMSDPFARIDPTGLPDAMLRLAGRSGLPVTIPITWEDRPFVIGRFDVSLGRKQCDFEFGKATKAVSRRHASLAREGGVYVLVDLHSSAGTYVNGSRIAPGEPCSCRPGDRLSFGNAGADYIFEEI